MRFLPAPDHRWCPVAGGLIKEEEGYVQIITDSDPGGPKSCKSKYCYLLAPFTSEEW